MKPTRIIAEQIVDKLEPTMLKSIAFDADSGNFEIENGRKQLIARHERMIKIVEDGFISALNSRTLR